MSDLNYENMSHILKALAHPVRLQMVQLLLDNECCVNNLCNILNIPQSTSSQHLGVLRNSGIIYPTKKGTRTCYVVKNNEAIRILGIMKEVLNV